MELLIAVDPTPGTWMWQWDNPYREDAPYSFLTWSPPPTHSEGLDGRHAGKWGLFSLARHRKPQTIGM